MAKKNVSSLEEQVKALSAAVEMLATREPEPVTVKRPATEPTAIVDVTAALAGAAGDVMTVHRIDGTGADITLRFGPPRMSKSGKAYVVAYGRHKAGALTVTATAYIALGKDASAVKAALR